MIETTTRSSMIVKPERACFFMFVGVLSVFNVDTGVFNRPQSSGQRGFEVLLNLNIGARNPGAPCRTVVGVNRPAIECLKPTD